MIDWGNLLFNETGTILGLMTLLVGAFSLFHAYISYQSKIKIDARDRTTALFNELYSLEGYTSIVAPVFNIMLKWNGLDDATKQQYQKIVIDGWAGFDAFPSDKIDQFCHSMGDDMVKYHYKKRNDSGEITEHEALTIFLYFWSKLELLVRNNLIDKKLTRALFTVPFSYYRPFLKDLRDLFDAHKKQTDFEPSWYQASLRLESFFSCLIGSI